MSAVETTTKPLRHIRPAQKAAMLAALVSGSTQAQVAKDFSVHPNTVYNIWKLVREDKSPANPANLDWKSQFRTDAQVAVTRGMRHEDDPIGAANIGLKVLTGIGDLVSGAQTVVNNTLAMSVSWTMPDVQDVGRTIDAPSNALNLAESASLSTDPT